MNAAGSRGFMLLELVIALSLGSAVIAALLSILTLLVRNREYSFRSQSVQLNLAEVDRLVERELRQASLVAVPSVPNAPSGTLEGCANAYARGASVAPVDADAPMRSFAFCSKDGIVYYYSQSGCPAVYSCGRAPTASFVWGPSPSSSLYFWRESSASTMITADMKASSLDAAAEIRSAIAFSAPAGGAQ